MPALGCNIRKCFYSFVLSLSNFLIARSYNVKLSFFLQVSSWQLKIYNL